jgi:hypothetical protein
MKTFRIARREEHKAECLEILRAFIVDAGNIRNGIMLVGKEKEIVRLLETEADLLTPEERYRVYGFMEGLFPEHFKRILAARLQSESDSKCRELLRAIDDLHSTPT